VPASIQIVEGSVEGLPNRIHEVIDYHVAATPDHPALIDDSTRLTYRELDGAVSRVADALQAQVSLLDDGQGSLPLEEAPSAHDEPDAYAAGERYLPDEMPDRRYYAPTSRGFEIRITEAIERRRKADPDRK
jgi:non-ribosomal peptide synthetase component F